MATKVLTHLGRWSLLARHLLLLGILLGAYIVALPVVWLAVGREGLLRAAVADGICWVSAAQALVVGQVLRGPVLAQAGVYASMMMRMALPLAAVMAIHLRGGALDKPDFVYELVFFYVIALAAETTMAVGQAGNGSQRGLSKP